MIQLFIKRQCFWFVAAESFKSQHAPQSRAGERKRSGEAGAASLVLEAAQHGFNTLGQTPSPGARSCWPDVALPQTVCRFYFLKDVRFSFLFLEKISSVLRQYFLFQNNSLSI